MIAESAYARLSTREGRAVLEAISSFDETQVAAAAAAARRIADADLSAAALATTFARRRARSSRKFPDADAMLFTHAGYEQATSSAVASHHAGRFTAFARVGDLCCGIGSDAVAIASRGPRVIACDIDPDALACAEHNAAAAGVAARVELARVDALALPLDGVDAAFADPSRRTAGARTKDPSAYAPSLHALLARAAELPDARLAVKVAPGLDFRSPALRSSLGEAALEVEVVSERGTCKEAILWCGGLARADGARPATVIADRVTAILDGAGDVVVEPSPLRAFVGEPDAAVIRAGLFGVACRRVDASPLDPRVAYVTASSARQDPFIRWFAVRDVLPFGIARLRTYLRERRIGELVVKTRAFPLSPDALRTLLRPKGDARCTLICTTSGTKKFAIACDPVEER